MNKKSAGAVLERLRFALGVDNDTELCKLTGVNRQTMSNWKSRDSVPYPLCVTLAESRNISLDWLLTGKGSMRKGEAEEHLQEQPLTPRQQAVLGLFNALPDEKQREILSALEDKKRMIDMEAEFKELKSVLAALKSAG
jgi:hypothetical protein